MSKKYRSDAMVAIEAREIRVIRERGHVSQSFFANHPGHQQPCQQVGARRKVASGASLKLLSLVEKNGLATVA